MLKNKRSAVIAVVFLTTLIIGFIFVTQQGDFRFKIPDMFIMALLLIFALISFRAARRKDRDKEEGLTPEDELSTSIKHKAGYKAYMASMYMWLIIFYLKNHFPDVETMLGGGILLSALIYYISTLTVRRELNA